MDYLWSPWRFRYVSEAAKQEGCPFCEMARQDAGRDGEQFILYRGQLNFVFLNRYPYTSGHLLVAPYAHTARLADVPEEALQELIFLARQAEIALAAAYRPEGCNMGMNLGRCAGAGVTGHLHLHFLPRWVGDANFMSVVGETRVQPEDLATTYDKLAGFFRS